MVINFGVVCHLSGSLQIGETRLKDSIHHPNLLKPRGGDVVDGTLLKQHQFDCQLLCEQTITNEGTCTPGSDLTDSGNIASVLLLVSFNNYRNIGFTSFHFNTPVDNNNTPAKNNSSNIVSTTTTSSQRTGDPRLGRSILEGCLEAKLDSSLPVGFGKQGGFRCQHTASTLLGEPETRV